VAAITADILASKCAPLGYHQNAKHTPVRPTPQRVLDAAERRRVLDHLHAERFRDKAPAEIYVTLLDEGIYLCSIRTMHRILAENGELKERRNQLCHPSTPRRSCSPWGPIKSGAGT
jgi:putative transposase